MAGKNRPTSMEQQYSNFYPYSQGNSKPRSRTTDTIPNWSQNLVIPVTAGLDMTRTGSDDSAYYSAATEFLDDGYHQKRSPPEMFYTASSPTFYSKEPSPGQRFLPSAYSPPLESFTLKRSHSLRETPSSLRWAPDGSFLTYYKFKIPRGKEPYFELREGYYGTHEYPEKVFLDPPSNSKKNEFPCLFPGCDAKVFKRPADLERHYRNVHGEMEEKETFHCDYAPCKARGAFTRKDHYRDHLRDYHKEDVGAMKREKSKKEVDDIKWANLQAAWIKERKIVAQWWRCPKCLQRVQIAESGYNCQDCKHPCDTDRTDRIETFRASRGRDTSTALAASQSAETGNHEYGYPPAASVGSTATMPAAYSYCSCGGTGQTPGSFDACLSCQSAMDQYYGVDNTQWDYDGYNNNSRY